MLPHKENLWPAAGDNPRWQVREIRRHVRTHSRSNSHPKRNPRIRFCGRKVLRGQGQCYPPLQRRRSQEVHLSVHPSTILDLSSGIETVVLLPKGVAPSVTDCLPLKSRKIALNVARRHPLPEKRLADSENCPLGSPCAKSGRSVPDAAVSPGRRPSDPSIRPVDRAGELHDPGAERHSLLVLSALGRKFGDVFLLFKLPPSLASGCTSTAWRGVASGRCG